MLLRRPEQGDGFRALGAEVAVGDLAEPQTLGSATDGVDAIIHLAAFFRGATPDQARATNLEGTRHLAEATKPAGVRRFLFVSTNLVYGSGRDRPAREDDELVGIGGYPVSKIQAERLLSDLNRTGQLGLRVLRLAFVYGEGDPHLTDFLPRLVAWHPGKRIHMVHHADVARAIMLAIDNPHIDGRTYNVADDEPVSVAEILQLFGIQSSTDASGEPPDPWEGIVDTTRIKDELGFRPMYPSLHAARDADAL